MSQDLQLSVHDVARRLRRNPRPRLLDTREAAEYRIVHLPGAELLTQDLLDEVMEDWERDTEIICYCHHGIRSLNAAALLAQQGFTNVRSMAGGIDRYAIEVDPSLPRY